MILVIYFHGFGSSPENAKVDILKKEGFKVVAPTIDIDPDKAETELRLFIKSELTKDFISDDHSRKVVFVGTSMGGFWAARMAEYFDCPSVLINPALKPTETLKQFIGTNKNYKTGKPFELTKEIVAKYKSFENFSTDSHRTYFVAKNDDVVKDVKKAVGEGPSTYHEFESDDHRGLTIFPHVIKHLKSI